MFRSGFSSASTLSYLSSFNGLISWFCYDIMGIEPVYVSAATARKAYGIKVPKGQKAKKVVFEYIVEQGLVHPEYTKKGNPKTFYYDMCDAIVIAKYGIKNT